MAKRSPRLPVHRPDFAGSQAGKAMRRVLSTQSVGEIEKNFSGTKTLDKIIGAGQEQRQKSFAKQDYENAKKANKLAERDAKRSNR